MGRYATLKKEFGFLAKTYGFEITMKQKHGAYYYIAWANPNKEIMVLYDEQVEDHITIRVYDADTFGFDADEYINEFDQKSRSPRENIHHAAEWLREAIENRRIIV